MLASRERPTFLIFLDIELPQQHDGFFAQPPSMCRKRTIDVTTGLTFQNGAPKRLEPKCLLGMDGEHASSTAKALVGTAEINGLDV